MLKKGSGTGSFWEKLLKTYPSACFCILKLHAALKSP